MLHLLLLLTLGCQLPENSVVALNRGITVSAPDASGRIRAAWQTLDRSAVETETVKLLERVKSDVAVDVADKFSGLEGSRLLDISQRADLMKLLEGTDENAAAEALRAAGAKVLVLHSAIRPSVDRGSTVISRLYHHDELSRFQLAQVGAETLVYLVVDQQVALPAQVAQDAVNWIRDTLAGRKPPPFPPIKPERMSWMLVTTIRGQGQELSWSLADGETLDKALLETVDDLERHYRRHKEILGFPPLTQSVDDWVFEIHRVTERATILPSAREEAALEDLWEMGIDGAVLLDKEKKLSGIFTGAVATQRSFIKADSFLKALAREFRFDSIRPWRDEKIGLDLIRTVHYREVKGKGMIPVYRGTLSVPLATITLDSVRQSILLAGEWYLANLQPDGTVTYKYWPEENRYSDEYNHVRHTLATWNLWQAWTIDPRPEFLVGAKKAQDWTMESLLFRDGSNLEEWEKKDLALSPMRAEIEREGMAYFRHANNNKLGSVVVGLFGMIELARATNDHSLDDTMRKLGRFVLFMQQENGSFRPYHVPEEHPYRTAVNDIVPGEAALALVYLYEYFQDPRYLEPLPKFFEHYKPWFRERAARKHPERPWPAGVYDNNDRLELVQFGPWAVMAADAYTRVRPEDKEAAEFGMEVARWMIESYQYTSDRTPYPDYVGGYYKFEGELPAMQAFCYAEGTAAAYAIALRHAPEQASYFEERTREAVRFGVQVQHDAFDTYVYSRPYQVIGGIRYAMNEPKVRIDYVYHAQSAMYQWLKAAERDPNLPASIKAPPDDALKLAMELMGYPGYRTTTVAAPTMALPGEAQGERHDDGEE